MVLIAYYTTQQLEAQYCCTHGPVYWAWMESDHRPLPYQDSVLPLNYMPKILYVLLLLGFKLLTQRVG